MERILPRTPRRVGARPGNLLLGAALCVAAVATLLPLLPPLDLKAASSSTGASPAGADAVPLPLGGYWQSIANGDRISRTVRDKDILWAATDGGGLVRWDLTTGTYRQFLAPQDGLASNQVNDLELMPDGSLWVATSRGLSFWNILTEKVQLNLTPATSAGMPSRIVTALEVTPDGKQLWVGFAQEWDPTLKNERSRGQLGIGAFRKGGLAKYDLAAGTWSDEHHVGLTDAEIDKFPKLASENITEIEMSATAKGELLYIGTRPFYIYDRDAGDTNDPNSTSYVWVLAGGGLTMFDGTNWLTLRSSNTTSACYANHITALAPDKSRMWIGTLGRGVVMLDTNTMLTDKGPRYVTCTGQVYYTRPRKSTNPGLHGAMVWSLDVDQEGRVWIGTGDGYRDGVGVAVLNHHNTFGDNSGTEEKVASDDDWEYLDVDGRPGSTDLIVSALSVDVAGSRIMGTRDNRNGDGYGLRKYDDATSSWDQLLTAANGLQSNHIVHVAKDPESGAMWFSSARRGVSRFDGQKWQGWRMFGAGKEVSTVKTDVNNGYSLLPVNMDAAAYNLAFPASPRYVKVGTDSFLYRVKRFKAAVNGVGPFLELYDELAQPHRAGEKVYAVDRGPASDQSTQLAISGTLGVWVGGRESVLQAGNNGAHCPTFPDCYIDGGISHFEGGVWTVYDRPSTGTPLGNAATGIPDQMVSSLEIDKQNRVWVGTGDLRSEGKGLAVFEPQTGKWTQYNPDTQPLSVFGGNGVADIDIDPVNGHVWVAQYAANTLSKPGVSGTRSRKISGGGVSHWDGTKWEVWGKGRGAKLRAFVPSADSDRYGDLRAIQVDRKNNLIWAGGWDKGSDYFHWLEGIDIDATINWCPLETCTNEGWQSKVFPNDGQVAAIEVDDTGNVWVGVNREGAGIIPSEGGLKLWNKTDWITYTVDNSGLVDNEVTALLADADNMWVGTLNGGVSYYKSVPPPTPTPFPTNTPRPTSTPVATDTPSGDEPTPTEFHPTVTPLPTNTPGTPTVRPTRTPFPTDAPEVCGAAGNGQPCRIYLSFAQICRIVAGRLICPRPAPKVVRITPTVLPEDTATPTDTEVPAPSPSPTASPTTAQTAPPTTAPPTSTPAGPATPTPTVPTAAPSQTPVPPTATRTVTPAVSPTPTTPTLKSWTVFDPQNSQVDRNTNLEGVFAFKPEAVWFVGSQGHVYFWDGTQLFSQALATQDNLVSGFALSASRAYIVGENTQGWQTTNAGANGQWRKIDVGSIADDWSAIGTVNTAQGIRGWLLGNSKGHRVFFDGTKWEVPSAADRNTTIAYSDVAVISGTLAYASTGGSSTGARIYTWNGDSWSPGSNTGPLFDMHVKSATQGVAVGSRGNVWLLGADGTWANMGSKPSTASQDLLAVHMVAPNQIWAAGGRGGLYLWDGIKWTSVTVQTGTRTIRGMWIAPDGSNGWAVGDDGLVLRYQ